MDSNPNKKQVKRGKDKSTWIGAFLLSIFYVLAQYNLPIMSYGLVAAMAYGGFSFLYKKKIVFNKSILIFTLWCIFSQLMLYLYSGTFEENRNTYFFMFVSMFLLATLGLIEKESFFKVYHIVGIVFGTLVIYQFILGNIFEIPQSAIRILPVPSEDMHFWIQNSTRVSGVFTEPQAYSSYILPLLIMLLFRKKFISAVYISISIFASTSSQGIIIALIIWGYYLVIYEKNNSKKIFRFLGGVFAVILALIFLKDIPVVQPIIDKIFSINLFGYDIRLTKGFQIYFAMPFWDKITGIGFGNLRDYLLSGDFHFFWMELTRDELLAYITTMANVLVSFGIFAFVFYINIFVQNWKSGTPEAKLMLIVIFVSSFTQTILFNVWYIFYWIVYEVMDKHDNSRYFYIKVRGE